MSHSIRHSLHILSLVLLIALPIPPAQALDEAAFAEVRALATSGAALLAQHRLDRLQPQAETDPAGQPE